MTEPAERFIDRAVDDVEAMRLVSDDPRMSFVTHTRRTEAKVGPALVVSIVAEGAAGERYTAVVVSLVVCPSDTSPSKAVMYDRDNLSSTNPSPALGLWYPASMGPTQPDHCPFCSESRPSYCCQGYNYGSLYPKNNSVGMFGRYPSGFKFAHVRDGLSNTLMLGETIPSQCVYMGAYSVNFPVAGTSIPMNTFEICDRRGGIHYRACGFKSFHPGGAQFAMGDGSIHFLSDAIDYRTYNGLGTRVGEESVSFP